MERNFRLKISYFFMLLIWTTVIMHFSNRYWVWIDSQINVGHIRGISLNNFPRGISLNNFPLRQFISETYLDNPTPNGRALEKTVTTTTAAATTAAAVAAAAATTKATTNKYNCNNRRKNKNFAYEDILCMKPPKFLKNYKNPCWFEGKPRSSRKRFYCLPYFNIIGSAKCGTTDLFKRITQHPQILHNSGVVHKETFYWSFGHYGECDRKPCTIRRIPFRRFLKFFPSSVILRRTLSRGKHLKYNNLITGHSDPMDIYAMYHWKHIPQNDPTKDEPTYTTPHLVHHVNPAIKLIVILREPSERLYSDFLFRRLGKTKWDFHSNVTKYVKMMKQCIVAHTIRACLLNDTLMYEFKQFNLHGSMYSVLLKEWMSVFPRKQFLILRTEDYKRDRAGTLERVYRFLGVEPLTRRVLKKISRLPIQNKNKGHITAGEMLPQTRVILQDFFGKYVKDLALMLNDKKFLWNDTRD